ncbi:MAG: serine/threonine protein kinase [Planctomycetota bacterium]|nr:serine/threonine protein kinase [Planctomycetota bacterium]
MNGQEVTQVGDYKIERKIASGLVSDVYLAKTGRVFMAGKVLNPDRAQKLDNAARFEDEIVHPNILRYEAIKFDPRFQFFFVTHYFDARPLSARILKSLRFNEIMDIFIKVGEALSYTHSFGTIHGNLKPSNILLVRVNTHYEVMLSDFGIGYIFNEEFFTSSILRQTYLYTAPELITYWMAEKNKSTLPENVSASSDVYSFALVLVEALTGKIPFVEEDYRDVRSLLAAKERKKIRLTAVNNPYGIKNIRELNLVLTRSLSYSQEERPSSITELVEVLKKSKIEDVSSTRGLEE